MPSTLPTTPLYTLPSHSAPINALVFSTPTAPTIPYILTGSSDRSIHLSNPNRGIPFSTSTTSITSRAPKPASTAYRAKDKNLPPPPGLIHSYEAHGYPVLDIAVTRDNARFVSGGGDKQVFLWDVETGQTSRRFGGGFGQASGHAGRVECVGFGGEEETVVVSGSQDTTLIFWDTKSHSPKPIQILTEARDTISALSISPHSHTHSHSLLTGSTDGRLRHYDLRMGQLTTDILGYPITSITRTKDGRAALVTLLADRQLLMDLETGIPLKTYKAEGYRNESLRLRSTLGANEGVVVCGGEADKDGGEEGRHGGQIFAFDVLSGEVVARLRHDDDMGSDGVAGCVAWTDRRGKSGGWWASGGSDGIVKIWGEKG